MSRSRPGERAPGADVPGLRDGGPAAVHDVPPGTGPPGRHRGRVPGLRADGGRVLPAAVLGAACVQAGTMMAAGQPGSSQPRGVFEVDEDRALEALRLAWADAYDVGFEGGTWTATSRDAEARTFTGDTPDALNRAIRADWQVMQ